VAVQQTAGKFKIDIDGSEVPSDVDQLLYAAVVEDNLNQPDLFMLSFRDAQRVVLEKTGAKIGSKVTITAFSDLSAGGDKLLSGEITALELEHDGSATFTILRGYDRSHRLFRGRRSETYQNVTYGDVVKKVAQRAGLQTGRIDSGGPVHPVVAQSNLSDWQLLQVLARDLGYEVAVIDGKLDFREPADSAQGPGKGDLTSVSNPLELTMGAHILRLRAIVTAAEQVPEVEVRGWDPNLKKPVVSTAPAKTKTATLSIKPADLANTFNSPKLVGTSVPYASQPEVDGAAKALADHVAGTFAEVDGLARGNSKLKAGITVSVSLAGEQFDGKYTLTSARHCYNPHDGYTTGFVVSGRNQRSLLGLASGGSSGGGPSAIAPPMAGVVPAVVTDVNDPDGLARVKVTFPWLSDSYVTDWARTVQAGAGANRGAVFLPEVKDEVLVAFDRGDWRRPYILGGLNNGVDKPKLGDGLIDGSTGAVKRRGIVSKHGHMLVFFDDASKDGAALLTGDQNLRISLNKGSTTISITSKGKIKIEGSQDVSVKSGTALTLEAGSKLSLKGPSIEIKADADVSVSGSQIKLG
jgi:phage protein D